MTNETLTEYLKAKDFKLDGNGRVALSDYSLAFQVNGKSVLFVAEKQPKAPLLLAPESDYTQKADQIGVSEESKIGESDFDSRYVIRDPDGKAGDVLSSEVISAVEALEPFVELEFTRKQYRLLKEDVTEEQAVHVVRKLEKLVGLTSV